MVEHPFFFAYSLFYLFKALAVELSDLMRHIQERHIWVGIEKFAYLKKAIEALC